jgi:16S rRNA processing protein RimM
MTQARAHLRCESRRRAHGVRGEVRLWPFTEDPLAVIDYGPLSTKDGARQFEVVRARIAKDHLVAASRASPRARMPSASMASSSYIDRDKLPETEEGEYYHADLIGLTRARPAGEPRSARCLRSIISARATLSRSLRRKGRRWLLPFTNAVVPTVDLASGRGDRAAGNRRRFSAGHGYLNRGPEPCGARPSSRCFPRCFPARSASALRGARSHPACGRLKRATSAHAATDKHRSVDDTPAGGGPGMVLRADVLAAAIDAAEIALPVRVC